MVCFLEYNAILMFNRWVFQLAVMPSVTHTIMLQLDNNAPYLTVRKVQYILDDSRIPARSADIAHQYGQAPARQERTITVLHADH